MRVLVGVVYEHRSSCLDDSTGDAAVPGDDKLLHLFIVAARCCKAQLARVRIEQEDGALLAVGQLDDSVNDLLQQRRQIEGRAKSAADLDHLFQVRHATFEGCLARHNRSPPSGARPDDRI